MAIEDLNHVNIRAPAAQLEAVRDFYVEVVGLVDGERPGFGIKGHWLYAGDRAIIHLMQSREGASTPVPSGGSVDHVAFTCSDLEGTERSLEAMGIAYRKNDFSDRGMIQLFLQDPTGLGVELNFSV